MGILFSFLAALSFAAGNIVIKKGLIYTNGESNGYLVTVTMNVILLGIFFLISCMVQGFTFHFSWPGTLLFVLAGLLTSCFGRFALYIAIGKIDPSRASAVKNAAPIFTVLFALLILGEHLQLQEGVGILLMLAAILTMAAMNFRKVSSSRSEKEVEGNKIEWVGYAIAIFAALSFGVGQGVRKQGLFLLDDAFFGAWISVLTAFFLTLILEGARGRLKTTIRRNWKHLNGYFVGAGIFTSTGPLCFFVGASLIEVSFVSVISAVEPLLTILLSFLLLRGQENLNLSVWISAALVLGGTLVIAFAT